MRPPVTTPAVPRRNIRAVKTTTNSSDISESTRGEERATKTKTMNTEDKKTTIKAMWGQLTAEEKAEIVGELDEDF